MDEFALGFEKNVEIDETLENIMKKPPQASLKSFKWNIRSGLSSKARKCTDRGITMLCVKQTFNENNLGYIKEPAKTDIIHGDFHGLKFPSI